MAKAKKKRITMPTIAPEDVIGPPEARASYAGTLYPTSSPSWRKYGTYWVHGEDDEQLFRRHFAECIVSGVWHRRSNMIQTIDRLFISSTFIAKKAGWVQCGHSGYWERPERMNDAYTGEGEPIKICNKYVGQDFYKCDVTNRLFHKEYLIKVKNSDKYKFVSSFHVNSMPEEQWPILRCSGCSNYYERGHITLRPKYQSFMCEPCFIKRETAGMILPHDSKNYPKPIFTKKYRFGHRIDDSGMIVATMMKQPVKQVRLYGVECEIEMHYPSMVKDGLNRFTMAKNIKDALGEDFVLTKEDGTLTMNGKYTDDPEFDKKGHGRGKSYAGFEIVSAPADLDCHRLKWPKIEAARGFNHLRSWDTTTCGFHIHVSKEALNTLQIGKILRFVNHPKNAKFIHKMAGRGSDRYCKYYDKEVVDAIHPERVVSPEEQSTHNKRRRVAVNISNPKTVEFRIFRGTIHPAHILRNLEFVDALCDFTMPATTSLMDMELYGKFLLFASSRKKDYPNLCSWLVKQKYMEIKAIKEGVDVSKLTLKPDMVVEDEAPTEKKLIELNSLTQV